MADTIAEAVTEAVENITENANVNVKVPASFEGMCVAYGSLVFMALLPIYFGAKRSVGHQKYQLVSVFFLIYVKRMELKHYNNASILYFVIY